MRLRTLLLGLLTVACDAGDPPVDAAPDSAVVADSGAPSAPVTPVANVDPVVAQWIARVDSAVFTRWGACPFECCVYRDWVAEAPVVVRVQPDSGAAVVATIAVGERFEADTGFVRITSPQIVIVTGGVEVYRVRTQPAGDMRDSLVAGDTLLVLDYQGEGHFMLTDGSELYSAEQFWTGTDGWKPYDGARGRAMGEHAAEWWARVRTGGGVEGWIDAYASELGNVDACGGPG